MEKTTIYSSDYKNRTIQIIRSNLQYFLIGSFAVSFIGAFIYTTLYQKNGLNADTLGLTSTRKDIAQAPEVELLTKKLHNQSISYSAPQPTQNAESLGTSVKEEQGQTSSISSGRVTYRRSKYIVQEGDSLRSIAAQVYGDENAWVRIARANKLPSPDAIEVGMELIIPR